VSRLRSFLIPEDDFGKARRRAMLAWVRRWRQQWVQARALRQLTRQARNPDPAIRAQAAADLARRPAEHAAPELIRLLEDLHTPVREAAQNALRQLGPAVREPMLEALNHSNPEVGKFAAEALADLGGPEVVGPLIAALKYAPRPVQMACRRALIRIGPVAVPALQAAVDDPQPWLKQQVREILLELGAPVEDYDRQRRETGAS
jgi:HEAT repeat protein